MDNTVHSLEVLHLVGLSTHRNMMHGTYSFKYYSQFCVLNDADILIVIRTYMS